MQLRLFKQKIKRKICNIPSFPHYEAAGSSSEAGFVNRICLLPSDGAIESCDDPVRSAVHTVR